MAGTTGTVVAQNVIAGDKTKVVSIINVNVPETGQVQGWTVVGDKGEFDLDDQVTITFTNDTKAGNPT